MEDAAVMAQASFAQGREGLPLRGRTMFAPCVEQPVCVAVRYLTLRIGRERHGSKNPLPFSFSKRSHVGNLRQTNE